MRRKPRFLAVICSLLTASLLAPTARPAVSALEHGGEQIADAGVRLLLGTRGVAFFGLSGLGPRDVARFAARSRRSADEFLTRLSLAARQAAEQAAAQQARATPRSKPGYVRVIRAEPIRRRVAWSSVAPSIAARLQANSRTTLAGLWNVHAPVAAEVSRSLGEAWANFDWPAPATSSPRQVAESRGTGLASGAGDEPGPRLVRTGVAFGSPLKARSLPAPAMRWPRGDQVDGKDAPAEALWQKRTQAYAPGRRKPTVDPAKGGWSSVAIAAAYSARRVDWPSLVAEATDAGVRLRSWARRLAAAPAPCPWIAEAAPTPEPGQAAAESWDLWRQALAPIDAPARR